MRRGSEGDAHRLPLGIDRQLLIFIGHVGQLMGGCSFLLLMLMVVNIRERGYKNYFLTAL